MAVLIQRTVCTIEMQEPCQICVTYSIQTGRVQFDAHCVLCAATSKLPRANRACIQQTTCTIDSDAILSCRVYGAKVHAEHMCRAFIVRRKKANKAS